MIQNTFFSKFKDPENLFLSPVEPTQVSNPKLLAYSTPLAKQLDLKIDSEWVQILAGNKITSEMKPFAVCYGGHQFGHWAGQLGDGRAITLGEIAGYELQLKGSGITPYSRQGDGRAVLRSSVREFLCSEAMFALGVPTTRALSLIKTGDEVIRDILYNGNPAAEPGAIVTRLSPSFVRFGNFEILAAGGKTEELKRLTDHIIEKFYPEISSYADFLKQISIRTAQMVSDWMSVGFVHGVMNTDNMSILGLTIDYGPYGWVENFDPDFTPNTTDFSHRRYRYAHQPDIALWNLNALANALYPLINDKEAVIASLKSFAEVYEKTYMEKMQKKLGFTVTGEYISEIFSMMQELKIDYTRFFRFLSDEDPQFSLDEISYLENISEDQLRRWSDWVKKYVQNSRDVEQMKKNNPSLIFRNYLAQQAIDDPILIQKYLEELYDPYRDRDLKSDPLTFKRPKWADDRVGCSYLSCSS